VTENSGASSKNLKSEIIEEINYEAVETLSKNLKSQSKKVRRDRRRTLTEAERKMIDDIHVH